MDVVIAVNGESSYELQRKNMNHRCIHEYYSSEEYFALYEIGERKREAIIEHFEATLASIDKRFPEIGFKPFYSNNYFIQLLLDDIIAVIFKLSKLFESEECGYVRSVRFGFNNVQKNFIAYDAVQESIYNALLPLMASSYSYQYDIIESPAECTKSANNECRLYAALKRNYTAFKSNPYAISKKLSGMLGHMQQRVRQRSRKRLLSIGCRDLEPLARMLVSNGWFLEKFPEESIGQGVEKNKPYLKTQEFFSKMHAAAEDEIFCFCGINFYPVLKEKIAPMIERLEYYYSYYKCLEEYVRKNSFNLVAFNSHTPHHAFNAILPQILKKEKIPYFCWMHGFYGCNETSVGWTNTDYLYGQNYLVYGNKVKEFIDTRHSNYGLQTFAAGAPRLENYLKNYRHPKNNIKVIVFVLQTFTTNRQPFGLRSPDIVDSHWQSMRYIIDQLKFFEKSYRIILRPNDGASGNQTRLLKQYLKDINAAAMEVITHDESTLQSLYRKSDLIINLWASMSLIEGCLTHSDIFLYDRSDLTKDAVDLITKRVFWYNNLEEFGTALKRYLGEGIFYQKSQDLEFLDSYMDIGNLTSREQIVLKILEQLKKG